jgi:hypothetical protein
MKIVREGERQFAEPTPDDRWCIIVFDTGPSNETRVTVVGPYKGQMSRVQDDRELWRRNEIPCVMARMMNPADFEAAVASGDLLQFGYAARIDLEARVTEWRSLKRREKRERLRKSA